MTGAIVNLTCRSVVDCRELLGEGEFGLLLVWPAHDSCMAPGPIVGVHA